MRGIIVLASLLLGVLLTFSRAEAAAGSLHPWDKKVMDTPTFRQFHPDLRWRFDAIEAMERGDETIARRCFLRAARFGDKLSRAMIAEMYWTGSVGPRDRELGYAWMDLAAERGSTPWLIQRESYWRELDRSGRESAIRRGEAVYAEYGDAVALPRLRERLRRGQRQVTGSRVGAVGSVVAIYPGSGAASLDIFTRGGSGLTLASGEVVQGGGVGVSALGGMPMPWLWEARFWDLDRYLAWKAVELDGEPARGGEVDVGVLRPLSGADTPP